ncbi:hypothetical protein IPH25_00985 [bacterium]|nr:MAG: hypothetical protein IPG37_03110 [bacterium]QQR62001.1 MAG: hypothetical protein IPH25_00985 [bacterium]QQR62405.1 MAG: hypothetical protein IPH67_03165 [bacterium]
MWKKSLKALITLLGDFPFAQSHYKESIDKAKDDAENIQKGCKNIKERLEQLLPYWIFSNEPVSK